MENTEPKAIKIDDIMKASFGEQSGTIRACFKKTVNIKQYETESVEANGTLTFDEPLSGIERMLVNAILQAQLEYEACLQLACKGYITNEQLKDRKKCLEDGVNLLKNYGEALMGKSLDYLFEFSSEVSVMDTK